ncbi:MAG: acetylornithine/succinylornithine family transaminase [Rhodobacteraceae bacterium]|nr:acetylornithine/succinylornithine family transaminase [Paracoccaceae bacterium]
MISPVLPTYTRAPLSFKKGQGPWLETDAGEMYLDMGAGIGVCSLGHAHPKLVAVLEEQARRLWHTSNLYEIPNQQALAEKLVEHTFADTVFFTNSGTEAMELAVKMARKYFSAKGQPDKVEIISFEGAFHGRSAAGIAASKGAKMIDGFGPLLPGFVQVPFNDLDAVKAAINENTAAILLEPIQGEGGIRAFGEASLKALREICDTHGLLLIMDEIQCGMGRTGKLFAHEWAKVTPDIMTIAKGIGGGFPLGACVATEEAASGMVAGTHGSTYGGNPLACAVGCAVMNEITSEGFLIDVSRLAGHLSQGLEGLVAEHPDIFTFVRGEGLMLALGCKVPVMDVVNAGYDEQVIVVPASDNVVRLLPPLNMSTDDLDEAVWRLDRAAAALERRLDAST